MSNFRIVSNDTQPDSYWELVASVELCEREVKVVSFCLTLQTRISRKEGFMRVQGNGLLDQLQIKGNEK